MKKLICIECAKEQNIKKNGLLRVERDICDYCQKETLVFNVKEIKINGNKLNDSSAR